jgi:hypothetical protein
LLELHQVKSLPACQDQRNRMIGCGHHSSSWGQGPVADCCDRNIVLHILISKHHLQVQVLAKCRQKNFLLGVLPVMSPFSQLHFIFKNQLTKEQSPSWGANSSSAS